jgi:hypothetical protein
MVSVPKFSAYNIAGGAYDTIAGAADFGAGSMDEAFHRQFDDEKGGGFRAGLGEEFQGDDKSFLTKGATGLASLFDSEPGNTAGPGDSSWELAENARKHGYVAGSLMTPKFRNALLILGGFAVVLTMAKGFGSGVAK